MRIVTPKQMKTIENESERFRVTKKQLMENAGRILADTADEYCRSNVNSRREDTSVVILCGKGNNGGDGYAAANILAYRGYKVTAVSVGLPETDLAKEMFSRLPKEQMRLLDGYRNKNVVSAFETADINFMLTDVEQIEKKTIRNAVEDTILKDHRRDLEVKKFIAEADVVIDCVYGTGFHGSLDDNAASLLTTETKAYCISADVASGGNCETGAVSDGCFRADETVAFGYIKTGMTQYPLREFCGKITVADIGLPERCTETVDRERVYTLIGRDYLCYFPYARPYTSHKGTFGNVLVIGGSYSMRGAAAFAALGALRSGAGLVRIASVDRCIDTVASLVPEATFLELECDDYGYMLYDPNRDPLFSAVKKADAIVLGCGMGVTPDTTEITRFVIENAECPLIIDADGINCLASSIDMLKKNGTDIIITPHVGEMARLIGCEKSVVSENRIAVAEKLAEKYNLTVVLKGAGTVVADRRRTAVNSTGNPGMSTGGSGDVLAGIIGSVMAQGTDVFYCTNAAVFMHGLAGDMAEKKLGMEAMLPRDIIDNLSDAFKELRNTNE